MTLSAGTRVGLFEILAPIGSSGIGEVYRARDTKLGRDVVIKVLPDDLSKDRERRERFTREAMLLASLNHPAVALAITFAGSLVPALRAVRFDPVQCIRAE